MGNASNVSSEEELLKLREEGKISQAEYQDLLVAMRNSRPNNAGKSATKGVNKFSEAYMGNFGSTLLIESHSFGKVRLESCRKRKAEVKL